MALSTEEVYQIAKLAQISISEGEAEQLKQELSAILSFVEKLSEVSTKGVNPTSHVHGVVNAFREDVVRASLPLEEVGRNAPDFSEDGFRVPKII